MIARIASLVMIVAGGLCLSLHSAIISAQSTPMLHITNAIEPGSWRITAPDNAPKLICLSDIMPLTQLAHIGLNCSRFVIEDDSNHATLHYSCRGAGWGRTSLKVETPRMVRISSQGIAANEPFAFEAEARRVGACTNLPLRVSR